MTAAKHRPQPWHRREIVAVCPSAVIVFDALREIAERRNKRSFGVSRRQLVDLTGLGRKTISKGLSTLAEAGWIARKHIPRSNEAGPMATLIRVTLTHGTPPRLLRPRNSATQSGRSSAPTEANGKTLIEGLSTPPTANEGDQGQNGLRRKGRSSTQSSPTEKSGPRAAPPSLCYGGPPGGPQELRRLKSADGVISTAEDPGDAIATHEPDCKRVLPPKLQAILDQIGIDAEQPVGTDQAAHHRSGRDADGIQ